MVHVKNPDEIEIRVNEAMLMVDIDENLFHIKLHKHKGNKKEVKEAIDRL